MSINASIIKEILMEKGIDCLYHVNTVETAITFLSNGGLLSRGAVEDKDLIQTDQPSDAKDKEVGVFYDIFFDSVDIHERSKNINDYGPVTFVYSIDVLDYLNDKEIKITKDNPIRWNSGMSEGEKYFTDVDSIYLEYCKGTFKQHLTICDMHEPLPFLPYLFKIIIDNPGIANTKYFDEAYRALKDIMENNGIKVPLEVRKCPSDCMCKINYRRYKEGYIYYKFRTN